MKETTKATLHRLKIGYLLSLAKKVGLTDLVNAQNTKNIENAHLSTDTNKNKELTIYFQTDLEKLSDLIDKDLRHWLTK